MSRFERAKEALLDWLDAAIEAQAKAVEAEFFYNEARFPREFSRNFYRDEVAKQGIGD